MPVIRTGARRWPLAIESTGRLEDTLLPGANGAVRLADLATGREFT